MRAERSISRVVVSGWVPSVGAPTMSVRTVEWRNSYHPSLRKPLLGSQHATIRVDPDEYGSNFPLGGRSTRETRLRVDLPLKGRRDAQLLSIKRRVLGRGHTITASTPVTTPLFIKELRSQATASEGLGKVEARLLSRKRRWLDGATRAITIIGGTFSGTSCGLLEEIQRHMLESTVDGGNTWELWEESEVLNYFNDRQARFLLEAGLVQTRTTISATAGQSDYALPSDLIDIKRVSWGEGQVLEREDQWSMFHGSVASSGTPEAYGEYPTEGTLKLRLFPTPSVSGTIHLLYVPNHTTITATCVNSHLPNFLMPYVKWGIVSDMLSKEGEAHDPKRAQYAEARFQEGIAVAQMLMGKV